MKMTSGKGQKAALLKKLTSKSRSAKPPEEKPNEATKPPTEVSDDNIVYPLPVVRYSSLGFLGLQCLFGILTEACYLSDLAHKRFGLILLPAWLVSLAQTAFTKIINPTTCNRLHFDLMFASALSIFLAVLIGIDSPIIRGEELIPRGVNLTLLVDCIEYSNLIDVDNSTNCLVQKETFCTYTPTLATMFILVTLSSAFLSFLLLIGLCRSSSYPQEVWLAEFIQPPGKKMRRPVVPEAKFLLKSPPKKIMKQPAVYSVSTSEDTARKRLKKAGEAELMSSSCVDLNTTKTTTLT